MTNKTPDTTRDAVLALHADGRTARQVAAELGIHRHTVERIVRDAGRPAHSRVDHERDRAMAEAYAAGESSTAIARRHGVDPVTVLNAVRRQGGAVRNAAGTRMRPPAEPAQTEVERAAATPHGAADLSYLDWRLPKSERQRNQLAGLAPRDGR